MPLVAAKCTECGANIEVDDAKEAGICKYCGTAFITEKAINNYNTFITNNYTTNNIFAGANVTMVKADITGLLANAKRELLLQNWQNANVYLDEIKKTDGNAVQLISDLFKELAVLEIAKSLWKQDHDSRQTKEALNELVTYDSQNIDVWLFMMETSNWAKDIISYGNKVMALAPEKNKAYYQNKVYEFYIKKEFDPDKPVSSIHLVDEIPASAIRNNNSLNTLLYDKCKTFIIDKKTVIDVYCSLLNGFAEKLRNNEKIIIQDMLYPKRHRQNSSTSGSNDASGGCYVATCVYGSYDCPEVWTLRRFRDYTLDTTWYGRLFIKCYYAVSPAIVRRFGQTKLFRAFWKVRLDKMVYTLNSKGVSSASYIDKY